MFYWSQKPSDILPGDLEDSTSNVWRAPSSYQIYFCFLQLRYALSYFLHHEGEKKGGVNSQEKEIQVSDAVGGIID
jgi:hypothetical protein